MHRPYEAVDVRLCSPNGSSGVNSQTEDFLHIPTIGDSYRKYLESLNILGVVKSNYVTVIVNGKNHPRVELSEIEGKEANWGLHPLIYTFGFWGSAQNAGVKLSRQGLSISCQDVKFCRSLDMICVQQVFGDIQDFTSIAEIFISNFCRITTICGNRISNEKVWSM